MFLDTSGLLAYFDKSDRRRFDARAHFEQADNKITSSYVLEELVPLCHVRRLNRMKSLEFVQILTDHEDLQVVWVDEQLHRAGMRMLWERLDKAYSLCDAVSFLIMRDADETDALTTDRHFEQEGFRRLLPD